MSAEGNCIHLRNAEMDLLSQRDYFLSLAVVAAGASLPAGGVQPLMMLTENSTKQQRIKTLRIIPFPSGVL